jgi:hypothetical protein
MPEREIDPVSSCCCGGFHYSVQQLCQKFNRDGYWVANLREKGGLFETFLTTSPKRGLWLEMGGKVGRTTCCKSLR